MVQTLSLVGAAFAVGGSYFALDSLRDVLIAKTINTPVATRLAMASAAVIGGLFLFGRSEGSAAGQRAKETAKEEIIAKIEAASEQFAAEPEDPNYMVKSDIHKIAESGIKMTVLINEYPDADLPVWLKSKLSVTASEADGVADNMGYALADPEAFDAENRGSRRDLGRFSRPRKPSAGHYRRKGRRAALGSLFSAESDDWPADVELAIGTHEELEHTDNAGEARRIAQDHLDENPNYYEILTSAGLVGRNLPPNRVAQTIRKVVALNTQERGQPAGNAWIWTPLVHPRTSEDAMAQVINIVAAIPDDGGMFHHSQFPSQEWAYLDDDSGMLHLITVSTHSRWKHLMVNIVQGTAKQSTLPSGFMRMIGRERRSRSAFTDKNAEDSNPYCHLYEKTQRWDDGRYRCGDRKGHSGRCSAWSRSGSGKQSFDGYPPCEHIKAGQKDCGCILGDGVDDSIGARLANHPLFKKKSAEYDQPIPAAGTPFTCDCGAECTVDATTEIAFGPGGYDLRCGRNDDCRGDEKVLGAESAPIADENCRRNHLLCDDCMAVCLECNPDANAGGDVCRFCTGEVVERFEAFSLSDRPVSVKFGPGTSGNAKMKATFTDASGDTKTTQFGYKGMSDFTKHKDEGRRSSYLARHGSKGQNQNWKDPTTAGALSRYVLWEKTSLPAAKSAFKKRFNLRAEGLSTDEDDIYIGYQVSPFITEWDRSAIWTYEPEYSITEESL